ncbi:MAG: hypothetical protein IKY43_06585 [Bacteroidales bacterium]|jgi:hypothetical protein|nr:hypothetical protein [Bacteroidales bacterium]
MMKRVKAMLLLVLIGVVSLVEAQNQQTYLWTCTQVKTSTYEAYVFSKEFWVDFQVENQESRYTPSNSDVDKAEKLIKKRLAYVNRNHENQENCPIIDENLRQYKRQYVGFTDAYGAKVLWINFVWDPKLDDKMDKEITTVEGGCSHYFHLKVNLDTETIYGLEVNEPGEVQYIKKVHKRKRVRHY